MRTIKFRAQDIASNKWLYGDLRHHKDDVCIFEQEGNKGEQVKRDTVGQFTGLLDKNGKEIYEGDIVISQFEKKPFGVITWHTDGYFFIDNSFGEWEHFGSGFITLGEIMKRKIDGKSHQFEVIGNIYEKCLWNEHEENEDERIRKGIIRNLEYLANRAEGFVKDELKERIAWLEKQGEQKRVDEVESKFREGDWIIHQGTENIYQVVACIDDKYQLKYGDNYTIQKCADVDRCARLWDITKDAKKGDVLVHNSHTFIFIGIEKGVVKAYEGTLCTGRIACNFGEPNIDKNYCPANKEQIDNLFNMIRKSGYEWNNEKKALVPTKIQN